MNLRDKIADLLGYISAEDIEHNGFDARFTDWWMEGEEEPTDWFTVTVEGVDYEVRAATLQPTKYIEFGDQRGLQIRSPGEEALDYTLHGHEDSPMIHLNGVVMHHHRMES